jgi:hypothetical protein
MHSSIRVFIRIRYLLIALMVATPVAAQVDVLTERLDNARTAINPNETILSKSNVKTGKFGKLAFRIVDGNIYAQILVVSQAKIADHAGPANVVIVATEHTSVYAFDADDTSPEPGGRESTKALWHTGPDVLGAPIPSDELYANIGAPGCSDITTEVGITSTPFIALTKKDSPKEGAIFVVAKSKIAGGNYVYKLFALGLSDGHPLGDPQGTTIAGQVHPPGGAISFDPKIELNRSALLVDNGTLYIAFGGHCDANDYHGWVFAYDVSNPAAPQKLDALASTFTKRGTGDNLDEGRGGIWMSGEGPAAEGNGSVYFVTGDGTYDVSQVNFRNLGNSAVRVKLVGGKIQVQDWYSPQNRQDLQKLDADLGSAGIVLVPNSHLLLAGGKEGRMYLIDRNAMGRGDTPSLHSFQVTNAPIPRVAHPAHPGDTLFWNLHGAPVVWPLAGQMFVYVVGEEDHLKQYKLVPDAGPAQWKFPSDAPFKTSPISAPLPPAGTPNDKTRNEIVMPGGFITVSSNGTNANSGIVWVTMPFRNNANREVVLGILRAFDASDVSKPQLWSTEESGDAADRLGMFAKFNPPTVANGKVYVATFQQERIDNGAHKKLEGGDQPALVIFGPK